MAEDLFEQEATLIFSTNGISKYTYKQIDGYELKLEEGFKTQKIKSDQKGYVIYRDKKNGLKINERAFCNGVPYLMDDNINFNWSIKKDKKEIGKYICQKATTKHRGRDYTAWFTSEIPVDIGPWKFHGLPGLIVEVRANKGDVNGDIYFKLNTIQLTKEAKPIGFNYTDTKNSYSTFRQCQLDLFNENTKELQAKAAALMAQNPGLEIEIESPPFPPYTENFN